MVFSFGTSFNRLFGGCLLHAVFELLVHTTLKDPLSKPDSAVCVKITRPKQVSSPARGNVVLTEKTLGKLLDFRADVVKHSRLADMQDYHFGVYDIDDGALTSLAGLV
jgi:hypothetical protein